MTASPKQSAILIALSCKPEITLQDAIKLVGNYYRNAAKHTGAVLSTMVRRGMIERIRPGVFTLPKARQTELGLSCEVWPKWRTDLPDSDTTVLIRREGGDDPVWIGFHADGKWWNIDGTRIEPEVTITGWMHFPNP